jgi:hypothetical protein
MLLQLIWKTLFLVGLIALSAKRNISLFLEPRLWKEDGAFFLAKASCSNFWNTITLRDPESGFLNLIGNIGGYLASTLVPLTEAPYVTTYLSFLIQVIPFLIILFGCSYIFTTGPKKFFGCLAVLLGPPATGDLWLNLGGAPAYLGVTAVIILMEDMGDISLPRLLFYGFLVGLAGLSGPYTIILWPAFFLRILVENRRSSFFLFGILTLAFLVQVTSAFSDAQNWGDIVPQGLDLVRRLELALNRHFLTPILTEYNSYRLINYFGLDQPRSWAAGSCFLALSLIITVTIFLLTNFQFTKPQIQLVLSFILSAFFTTIFADIQNLQNVNFFTGGITLLFILITHIGDEQDWPREILDISSAVLLITGILLGASRFFNSPEFICEIDACPQWKAEVQQLSKDPEYNPLSWSLRSETTVWRAQICVK